VVSAAPRPAESVEAIPRRSAPSARAVVVACLLALPLVTPKIRGADEIEGFAYLRSAVFDHDLEFGDEYQRFYEADPGGLAGFKATFLDRREPDTGRHINFTPVGSALLWSPFYLLAHGAVLAARALGAAVPADGYSRPYVAAVCYASWLYASVGLVLTFDFLRRSGHGARAAAATVGVLWGTPAVYYMTIAPAFSHADSMFTIALVLWLSVRFQETRLGVGRAALLGLLGGVAGLVREQDALVLAVPAGLIAWRAARERRLREGFRALAALAAAAVMAFSPQLLAYHAINGSFGPSRLVTRKMTWASPHLLEVLFDPGHGLFVWSPLLLVAALGLALALWRRRDALAFLLLIAFLLQAWINGAVESWTQAGAFGSRRFLGLTPVFAWGLAAVLGALRRPPRLAVLGVAVCVWWNLSLVVQFGLKLMDRQRLEWPRVARNQVTEVPRRLGRVGWLMLTDRERLVREGS
jgi:hypothetical protein